MKLYRISLDLSQKLNRLFFPMIPESALINEDKTIERVCLSSSIEGCLQAIPKTGKKIKEGTKFIVYEVEINPEDINLIYPEEVRNYVPDALENEEYWYLSDLYMNGRIETIKNIDFGIDYAFTAIDEEEFECVILDLFSEDGYKYLQDVMDILEENVFIETKYREIINILSINEERNLINKISREIERIDGMQTLKISNLEFI